MKRLLFALWLLIAAVGSTWAQERIRPTLISVQGATTVLRSGAVTTVRAVRNMGVNAGDIVSTGPDGHATLMFADGSVKKLRANTNLLIVEAAADRGAPPRVELRRGEIWAHITRGRRMHIQTPTAAAAVRGTELDLAVADDGTTTLTVGDGEVRLENDRGSVIVGEGQQSVAQPGRAPTPPAAVNVPFIIQWTNDVQPVALLLEVAFVGQDPAVLAAALREAELGGRGREGERERGREGSSARWQRFGDVRHDRGELQDALTAYEAARAAMEAGVAAAGPARIEARIGQTLLELGELPEAEAAFRRSLMLDPTGGADDAVIVIRATPARPAAHSLTPSLPLSLSPAPAPSGGAHVGLVMTLLSRRESAAALAEAQAAVKQDGRSPVAQTTLALAHLRAGERDAAQRALEQALALDEGYAQAHAWRSFLLRAEGRLHEADTEARRAVVLAPFSSLARSSLAEALFAQGRLVEAREEARRAVALNPLSPGARVSLGRTLLQAGELERAVAEANKAAALDPDLERARFFLGVVLAEQRRLERAARELRQAVALDPGYLEARAFLARVYLEQGRRAEAVEVVREAIARDPDFAPARAALGQVHWRAGQLKEAAEEYRTALKLAPGAALYHLELSRVYLDGNNLPDALAHGLAAVDAAPRSSEAYAALGRVYDRMSNPEQALRAYREALARSPDNGLARFGLGLALINPRPGAGLVESAQASFRDVFRDGQREVAQAALRDPTLPSLLFKPGVTTEITPGAGSEEHYSLGFTHRDQFARGKLHDLSFGSQDWLDNDRNGRQERGSLAVTSLMAAPSYRTHLLGTYFYTGEEHALPGSIFQPDADDREYNWLNFWSLATRYQADPATFMWFHTGYAVQRFGRRNPDAPADGSQTAVAREETRQLSLEGRLDHRWGGGHTTSYILSAARGQFAAHYRLDTPLQGAFTDADLFSRPQRVAQTLQDVYLPGSRLSLILGLTTERFTQTTRAETAVSGTLRFPDQAETGWLPYGQATYALTRRDVIRAIFHRRRNFPFNLLLQPAEAFLLGESPAAAVDVRTTNYELDYEHRFTPRSFAKLFLFRNDVEGLRVEPAVIQTPETRLISEATGSERIGFRVPKARIEGIGLRYERQIGRFLSSFLRYTYSEATDRTGLATRGWQVPLNPRSRAVLGLNYIDRAGSKLFAELEWRDKMFVDPVWSNHVAFDPLKPRPTFPAKLVVNLRFARERTVRREWVFRIHNLFDTELIYWPGFPAPGRTFQVQYSVRF